MSRFACPARAGALGGAGRWSADFAAVVHHTRRHASSRAAGQHRRTSEKMMHVLMRRCRRARPRRLGETPMRRRGCCCRCALVSVLPMRHAAGHPCCAAVAWLYFAIVAWMRLCVAWLCGVPLWRGCACHCGVAVCYSAVWCGCACHYRDHEQGAHVPVPMCRLAQSACRTRQGSLSRFAPPSRSWHETWARLI